MYGNGADEMLPEGITITTVTTAEIPTTTFKIDFDKNKITHSIDEIEALKQMIYLLLNTEYRYSDIYDEFGLKVADLIGQDFYLIASELQRRITEALLKDERIVSVLDFEFTEKSEGVLVYFTVSSIYGDTQISEVISV